MRASGTKTKPLAEGKLKRILLEANRCATQFPHRHPLLFFARYIPELVEEIRRLRSDADIGWAIRQMGELLPNHLLGKNGTDCWAIFYLKTGDTDVLHPIAFGDDLDLVLGQALEPALRAVANK